MNYHWNYKETSKDVVENIKSKFNLPKPIAVIMAQRGIKNKKNFNQYCDININSLHDPFLMLNMKKSVEFIKTIIEINSKFMHFLMVRKRKIMFGRNLWLVFLKNFMKFMKSQMKKL